MTVGVAIKVFDGVVLASDSATTFNLPGGSHQVYNNANKLFQLHRSKPIGAFTWGDGNIGSASIATLAKDLRRRLMGLDDQHADWELGDDYTVEQVADRLIDMMFDELYAPAGQSGGLGFFVTGFSGGAMLAEGFDVQFSDPAHRPVPNRVWATDDSGWFIGGQSEAVVRLLKGIDPGVRAAITPLIAPEHTAVGDLIMNSSERLASLPAMPFADAVGLAEYLVAVTVGYSRYLLGPDTVGGSIDIAGISRHEHFKWIRRKHYYPIELNPRGAHEHDQ